MLSKCKKDTCSHNWIHNAGKQCEWDNWGFKDSIKGIKPEQYKKDSNNLCNFYICTMCGEEIWSQSKLFNIPHYRVREERKQFRFRRLPKMGRFRYSCIKRYYKKNKKRIR